MLTQMHNEISESTTLKEMIANLTGTNVKDWFLTFRSRDALNVIAEEIKRHKDTHTISLQPFTCATVPGSVINGGCLPLYSDISIHNLSTDIPKLIKECDTSLLGAVVVQHTYGLIDEIQTSDICSNTDSRDYLLIEDSAHCVGRIAVNEEGNPVFDISIHSFGVEKILDTHFGAAVWISPSIKDKELRDSICAALSSLPLCSNNIDENISKYLLNLRILNHIPNVMKKRLRDRWMHNGYFVPAVSDVELEGGCFLQPSLPGVQTLRLCIDALRDIESNEENRLEIVEIYSSELNESNDILIPASYQNCKQPLLWFPILAENRLRAGIIRATLTEAGFYSSKWGCPLLFPGVTNNDAFRIDNLGLNCPISQFCSDRIVLLPTKIKKRKHISLPP